MRTILALGNPGSEYEGTRHNAGFALADRLAERWDLGRFRRDGRVRIARGTVRRHAVELLKPQTYMNRSGAVLSPVKARVGFDPSTELLVVVDEAALPLGRFRLRARGSPGGHNGLKSIEGALRSDDYARLRIGVGPVPDGYHDLADYVLDGFEPEEAERFEALLDPMADAVECWITDGIDAAMNKHNRKSND